MPKPAEVETRDQGSIYNADTDAWYPGWQTVFRPSAVAAAIDIATADTFVIIPGESKKRIKIVALFFTVGGEVDVTLSSNGTDISGPMDFGGDGEPRGIVIPFPYSPLELEVGDSFEIGLSAAVQVSGTVCYFLQ